MHQFADKGAVPPPSAEGRSVEYECSRAVSVATAGVLPGGGCGAELGGLPGRLGEVPVAQGTGVGVGTYREKDTRPTPPLGPRPLSAHA